MTTTNGAEDLERRILAHYAAALQNDTLGGIGDQRAKSLTDTAIAFGMDWRTISCIVEP